MFFPSWLWDELFHNNEQRNTLEQHLESGPLLALKFFDIFCIKVCSMHCLNLGLLYTANGSSLFPGGMLWTATPFYLQKNIVLFYLKRVWPFWTSHVLLRSTLVELGCFGDPTLDMKTLLVQAWEDYHAWCKENKVHPGQGRFTPGLVSWQLMMGTFFQNGQI